ncbi:hypothetical protein [Streptomyces sp. AD55]|uniref:hypothetical protein n=1 Tax=Streptomyces sp. AD55 TaxID=3242895 RepID=UPI003528FA0C
MLDAIGSLPLPGFEPERPSRQLFAAFDDGVVARITVQGDREPALTRGGRLISEAEYEERRAAMAAAHDARLAELHELETARCLTQYQDLTRAGIPDATARSLSGYTGPAQAPGQNTRG